MRCYDISNPKIIEIFKTKRYKKLNFSFSYQIPYSNFILTARSFQRQKSNTDPEHNFLSSKVCRIDADFSPRVYSLEEKFDVNGRIWSVMVINTGFTTLWTLHRSLRRIDAKKISSNTKSPQENR